LKEYPFGFGVSVSDPSRIFPYELDEIRSGVCKCGNTLKVRVKFYWEIQQSQAYCIECNNFTPVKLLEVTQ